MLSLFPSLLSYERFGPFLIRIVLGITLGYFGYKKVIAQGTSSGSNARTYGAVEIFVSLFLIIGLYTQLAALINAIILVIKISFKARDRALFTDGINYYVLLLAMALSVIVTGAGAWAFDLPL